MFGKQIVLLVFLANDHSFQVTKQCESYVLKVRDANDKVNFTLYYETLCPDCREFMKTQLHKAYGSILDIMNISLVPYGNAQETYDSSTQLYQFDCQHGAQECLGNLIHVRQTKTTIDPSIYFFFSDRVVFFITTLQFNNIW